MINPFIKDVPFFGAMDQVLKHTEGAFQELQIENLVAKQVLRHWQILSKHVGSTLSTMMINANFLCWQLWCGELMYFFAFYCNNILFQDIYNKTIFVKIQNRTWILRFLVLGSLRSHPLQNSNYYSYYFEKSTSLCKL